MQTSTPDGSVEGGPGRDGAAHAWAAFAGVRARGAVEAIELDEEGIARLHEDTWFVVVDFEGRGRAWRFAHVAWTDPGTPSDRVDALTGPAGTAQGDDGPAWAGPPVGAWRSSLDEAGYRSAVEAVRERIRQGGVYQANICRVLQAPCRGADGAEPDAAALARRLHAGNPAPHAGALHVPAASGVDPVWVVSASPELFLQVGEGRIVSAPIKGTAARDDGLTAKDRAENVMITDLVRNDLQRVCLPGTVEVERLLQVERHPGLVHLVSTVAGRLAATDGPQPVDWAAILAATFPPASVSGAPKEAALDVIRGLEPVPRGPYCGAVGWIDGPTGRAELAVGIRTFWWTDGVLRFGTGAGITWSSDPAREWEETRLKAARLIALASEAASG